MRLVLAGGGPVFDAVRGMVCSGGVMRESDTWRYVLKTGSITGINLEDADLLLCVGHPQILTKELLGLPRLGCVNLHSSLLPHYRGRHPVQWAMINGEPEIGMTLHYMDEGIDTGDIILQESVPVEPGDTLPDVMDRLIPVGCRLVLTGLAQLRSGTAYRRSQGTGGGYWQIRLPEHSRINWENSSQTVTRFVNALADPRFYAFSGRHRYSRAYMGKPGELLTLTVDGCHVVATGDGVVLLQPVGNGATAGEGKHAGS